MATVPGIGPKTGERVVLELRDKLDGLAVLGEPVAAPQSEHAAVSAAVAGLVGLGFRESEARSAIAAVSDSADDHDVAGANLASQNSVRSPLDLFTFRHQPQGWGAGVLQPTNVAPMPMPETV